MHLLKWKDLSLQVSGISTEIFKQIETVENDHDASTAAALEAVERRGEMVVRVIEPRQMGRQASEAAKKFIAMQVCSCAINCRQYYTAFHVIIILTIAKIFLKHMEL